MTDSLRLFLIEDNDDQALVIRRILQRAGHQVTQCHTGANALIVLGDCPFDLVLLDQCLPDMQGIDLLDALAREGIPVPVLMMTGYGDEHLATQCFQRGAVDYVVKDPDLAYLNELPKRVRESVTRHQLQQRNRLLSAAVESARDGIVLTDVSGRILHVNQALEGMTGHTRQELLGRNVACLQPPTDRPGQLEELCRTVSAESSWQGECALLRKDGNTLEVSLTVSPILDARKQLTHFSAIVRDITERRALEKQLMQAQKMQSVGTLAGGVAHEFNNLLAGINGYAALGLREPDLAPTIREFLEHIVHLSERAAVLTRQMLTFARKPPLTRRAVDVVELLRSTKDLITRTLHTEVEVELCRPGETAEALLVQGDANQLQQALVNLALNARDALVQQRLQEGTAGTTAPLHGITFRLRHALLTSERAAFPQGVPPGDYVVLEVLDQGCGMSDKVLNQALDPFFTTKDVGQGTGLGLPMVFGIIQGHQGFLTIDTAPHHGTCVGLYLPHLRLDTPEREDRQAPFEAGQGSEPECLPGRHILVIDDEEAVRDVVRRFLEIAGHHVSCVASGQQALELLSRQADCDLVVLDLMLPREDGVATFRRLRQRRPGLPVLLCTGLVQADPLPEVGRGSAVGILRKPFSMKDLWCAVRQALAADAPTTVPPA